jgi:hypothetical protein
LLLEAHQLAPHRARTLKLLKFAEKLRDIVGLYVDPPEHAVVLSVDEKQPNPCYLEGNDQPRVLSGLHRIAICIREPEA